jgi:hypothetical protein
MNSLGVLASPSPAVQAKATKDCKIQYGFPRSKHSAENTKPNGIERRSALLRVRAFLCGGRELVLWGERLAAVDDFESFGEFE